MLIINADDWGGWKTATDAAMDCFTAGRITSASAMVFMGDSQRAAELARAAGIDVGLHVNFNLAFSDPTCPPKLRQHQHRIRRFLNCNKYARLLYNPLLRYHFRCVYQAQIEEFQRLYRRPPSHIDGHQHMHLCTNMLIDKIIRAGEHVRRSFSFWPGEKSALNRLYRRLVDRALRRRYRLTDYFFSLEQCLRQNSLFRVSELAAQTNIELMAHPEQPHELAFLMGNEFSALTKGLRPANYTTLTLQTSRG